MSSIPGFDRAQRAWENSEPVDATEDGVDDGITGCSNYQCDECYD
jgi:hypothetical protein